MDSAHYQLDRIVHFTVGSRSVLVPSPSKELISGVTEGLLREIVRCRL